MQTLTNHHDTEGRSLGTLPLPQPLPGRLLHPSPLHPSPKNGVRVSRPQRTSGRRRKPRLDPLPTRGQIVERAVRPERMEVAPRPNPKPNVKSTQPFKFVVTCWKCSLFLCSVRTLPSASSIAIVSSSIMPTVQ